MSASIKNVDDIDATCLERGLGRVFDGGRFQRGRGKLGATITAHTIPRQITVGGLTCTPHRDCDMLAYVQGTR